MVSRVRKFVFNCKDRPLLCAHVRACLAAVTVGSASSVDLWELIKIRCVMQLAEMRCVIQLAKVRCAIVWLKGGVRYSRLK